jgi:REP element-mobilizing transposase RayT
MDWDALSAYVYLKLLAMGGRTWYNPFGRLGTMMTNPTHLTQGQIYHIQARGRADGEIFFEDRTYAHFLRLYAKSVGPVVDTYAYCLLPDHLHVLVRTRTATEAPAIYENPRAPKDLQPGHMVSILFDAYTKAINQAYGRSGDLFLRPFARVEVRSDVHLVHLIAYIHQNPEKHGLVEDFRTWPHSSYHALLSEEPTQLQRQEVLAWFDGPAHFRRFHNYSVIEALIEELIADDMS